MTPLAMAQRIELWPIEKLVPYTRNPRTHSEAQIAQIAASIVEFGFNCPILVDTDSGIVAGHGRLAAAKKLKLEQVPVIVLDHLTPAQRRAYLLADNKLAELAGWDEDLLRLELQALERAGFDLDVVGFSDEELAELLAEPASEVPPGLTDEDAAPELREQPVSRTDDLWVVGRHCVMCGDATRVEHVQRLMGGEQADVVFTDPPYTEDRLTIKGDRMADAEFKQFLEAAFRSYRQFVKPGASSTFATRPPASGSSRMLWRAPASRCGARLSGRRTRSPGASAVINFSTSRSSTATSRGKAMHGMAINRSQRSGRRISRRRIVCIPR